MTDERPRVQVVLPLPLPTSFTYGVPPEWVSAAVPGARVTVPFGHRTLQGVIVPGSIDSVSDGEVKDLLEVLDDEPALTTELLELTRWIAEYYMCSWGEAARAALPPTSVAPLVERHVRLLVPEDSATGARQKAVLDFLRERTERGIEYSRVATVTGETGASHATVAALEKRGLVEVVDMESTRTDRTHRDGPALGLLQPPELSAAQDVAVCEISEAVLSRTYSPFLLHGVTGSGKTEVYMAALDRTLEGGRSGIVLVPEIALTPQTVRRFRARFGDRIAVLHSRMAAGERFDTWREIRAGRLPVVIGPRSAIFAPVPNLGLIVVDEEHESSYKQFDPAPRYHARDVALVRAQRAGAVCILGSATPSLETWHNASTGKIRRISLPDRIAVPGRKPARLPDVRIIDLVAERRSGRGASSLSATLVTAIERRLAAGEQIILLQNRRGYAPVLECVDCGWSPTCPDCSVTLTVHKTKRQLRCHYCGRAFRLETRCGECSGGALEQLGTGTQRVEEEIAERFPDARLLRMDFDSTGKKDAHDRILARFGSGEADILIGTQMVAKGLDFERVTLVGVIDADAGLLFPDFRSDERIFQLLTQVAGRAGRADLHGEVLLQTRHADHPVIRLARHHDFEGFVRAVLPAREELSWPPYTRLVRIDLRGPEERPVADAARRWAEAFDPVGEPIELLGPAPAFIARVNRTWRHQLILRAPRSVPPSAIRQAITGTSERVGRLTGGIRITIDVDPMGLL